MVESERESPAKVELHDRFKGLERLICQQDDKLQLLMKELLVEHTKAVGVCLQELAERIGLEKDECAVRDELPIVPTGCCSTETGLGLSINAEVRMYPDAFEMPNWNPPKPSSMEVGFSPDLEVLSEDGMQLLLPPDSVAKPPHLKLQTLDDLSWKVAEKITLDKQGAGCDELEVGLTSYTTLHNSEAGPPLLINATDVNRRPEALQEAMKQAAMPVQDSQQRADLSKDPEEEDVDGNSMVFEEPCEGLKFEGLGNSRRSLLSKIMDSTGMRDSTLRLHKTISSQVRGALVKHLGADPDEHSDEHDYSLIRHPMFQAVIQITILANALQLGMQVDLNFGLWVVCWTVLDNVFTAIFAFEMIVSICCLGWNYFDRWHCLDFFVAWSSIVDTWILRIAYGNADGHPILKVFQFLRLLRMLKILSIRRDLRLLIAGIADSLSSMVWVSVLLFLIIYTFAIICVNVIGDSALAGQYSEKDFDNVSHFGTLLRAMSTLFSISVLDSWSSIIGPVAEVQVFMVPFFLFFLVMTAFALLNALIGIICERTSAATKKQNEMDDKKKREARIGYVKELVSAVDQIDQDGTGVISREEMVDVLCNPDFQHILENIELPSGFSGVDLHMMLDENGNGEVPIEEFIGGMFQLIYSTEFQSQCLAKLSVAKIKKSVFELRQDLLAQMQEISRQISAMQYIEQAF